VEALAMTDLFAMASESLGECLVNSVPPVCRRPLDGAPVIARDGEDLLLVSPAWRPRTPAVHLLPSFALLTTELPSFRFELSVVDGGDEWSDWIAALPLGSSGFAPFPTETPLWGGRGTLTSDVDVFRCTPPAMAVRLRLRLRGLTPDEVVRHSWLLTLSTWDGGPSAARHESTPGVALDVPARSQHEEGGIIGHRLCSPTSVAMVLDYWGRHGDLPALAAEMLVPSVDLYGVWPAAIRTAAHRGIAGYLLRFPDWSSAAWCLARKLPVIASVRYGAGELTGAAVAATPGHLVVLTGLEGDTVLVNDPAAPTAREVRRRYPLDEVCRVWLERTGVGYVLFDPAGR
jgi:Peptidase_C39 like family